MLSMSLSRWTREPRGAVVCLAVSLAALLVIWLALAPAANAATCPSVVKAADFTGKRELEKMTAKFNSYGPRVLGSTAHNKAIAWLEKRARAEGLRVRSQSFKPYGWFPRTRFKRGRGLDIGAAGGLSVTRSGGSRANVSDAGAVHWSKPTAKSGEGGPLVYLAKDQEITAANAAGKVVVRDFPIGSLPFGAVGPLLGIYLTPDLEGYTEYTRPYLATLHEELIAAGRAGAAGVVFAFDVPGRQVRGYYDPHVGTLYRVPAVFVGSAEAARLRSLAAQGSSARVTVLAKVARKRDPEPDRQAAGAKLREDRDRSEHRRQLMGPGERGHRDAGVRSLLRRACRSAAAPARWSSCSRALTTGTATTA